MKTSNEYEIAWWNEGFNSIIGIDEAGRGPIAGVLVVAAVSFDKNYSNDLIYDSKGLSEKKRLQLFDIIKQEAKEYYIKIVSIEEIDTLNIYRATQKANEELVKMFKEKDGVLTDAMPLLDCDIPCIPIIKGDQKSVSIAAASILAKVTRDNIMYELDKKYPEYGFASHKGYPTKKHIEALEKYGVLDIHRKSYKPVQKILNKQLGFDI